MKSFYSTLYTHHGQVVFSVIRSALYSEIFRIIIISFDSTDILICFDSLTKTIIVIYNKAYAHTCLYPSRYIQSNRSDILTVLIDRIKYMNRLYVCAQRIGHVLYMLYARLSDINNGIYQYLTYRHSLGYLILIDTIMLITISECG